MISFDDQEKIKAFDRISELFLRQNYGSVSKSELELLFFAIVFEHLQNHNESVSDYAISNILGVTQQRVRSLKIKHHLRYQDDCNWKTGFLHLASQAEYATDGNTVTISIDNPVLQLELQHFLETHGGLFDRSFNMKLMKIPVQSFATLLVEIGLSENEARALELLRESYRKNGQASEEITKQTWQHCIKGTAIDVLKSVVADLLKSLVARPLNL